MPFFALAAAGISAAGSIFGSVEQANSAKKATNVQQQMFDTTQKNLSPFIQGGGAAVPQWQALLGLGPQGAQGEEAALAATPGYQFELDQGLQGILSKATATGGVGGGNTLKALMQYGTGLADQTYQQSVGNIAQLAQTGESAAAGQGTIGANTGANIANTITQGGNAVAGGAAGVANAGQSGISNYLLAQLLQGGGGGGGGAQFGIPEDIAPFI